MLIINSSNYIPESFAYDFGEIPDIFLPIGNTRLIDILIKRLYKNGESIFIIIPDNFNKEKISYSNLSFAEIFFLKESQFMEIFDLFRDIGKNKGEKTKYINRLAFPVLRDSEFENYKKSSSGLPSFGLSFNSDFQNDYLKKNEKNKSLKDLNESIYQLYLFNPENTNKLKTIDLRITTHYYNLRAELVGLRFFNRLKILKNKISKTVEYSQKGIEEANWFINTKKYLPHISPVIIDISKDKKTYISEYLPMVSLSEIYTYGQIDINHWDLIFESISSSLKDMHLCALDLIKENNLSIKEQDLDNSDKELFINKTIERLKLFSKTKELNYPFEVSLNNKDKINVENIIEFLSHILKKIKNKKIYIHGDFCLSNILYDSRMNIIKLVDPRGHKTKDNFFEMIKSHKYDLTKLSHSLLGFYDLINVGEIETESFNIQNNIVNIQCNYTVDFYHKMIYEKAFDYNFLDGIKLKDYLPISILLFLSMLPLHSDNEIKQITLLGNAIRIYESLF